MTSIVRLAAETSYHDVRKLVQKEVSCFVKARPGFPYDQAVSAAGLAYARAYRSYDPDRAAFTTWVAQKVRGGLLDQVEADARVWSRERGHARIPDDVPEPEGWTVREFLEGLSDDAQQVVLLVFDQPIEVSVSLAQMGGESPVNVRSAVREFLGDLGWTAGRIASTFREIKEAL